MRAWRPSELCPRSEVDDEGALLKAALIEDYRQRAELGLPLFDEDQQTLDSSVVRLVG